MAKLGWFRSLWLHRFSQPAAERQIYRLIARLKPQRILELGLGTLQRTERVLTVAGGQATGPAHYVGLDRFEGRLPGDPPGVSLKEAHRRLHALARVQLVPGNVDASLSRVCNHLGMFDLVLVSADNDPRHLERTWFFIQRLVGPQTTVLLETRQAKGVGSCWKTIDRQQVDALASRSVLKRAA
jgi:hypothetical protein